MEHFKNVYILVFLSEFPTFSLLFETTLRKYSPYHLFRLQCQQSYAWPLTLKKIYIVQIAYFRQTRQCTYLAGSYSLLWCERPLKRREFFPRQIPSAISISVIFLWEGGWEFLQEDSQRADSLMGDFSKFPLRLPRGHYALSGQNVFGIISAQLAL
jgi:hypothetical protein